MKERRPCQKLSLKSSMDPSQSVKCKIVVVGDSQCGKTALLHVFAKDCFPEVRPCSLLDMMHVNNTHTLIPRPAHLIVLLNLAVSRGLFQ